MAQRRATNTPKDRYAPKDLNWKSCNFEAHTHTFYCLFFTHLRLGISETRKCLKTKLFSHKDATMNKTKHTQNTVTCQIKTQS